MKWVVLAYLAMAVLGLTAFVLLTIFAPEACS